MKITQLTTYRVPPRWLFLKIDTDACISGWGEPAVAGRARTLRRRCRSWPACSSAGTRSASTTRGQQMYRGAFYRGGPVSMSAIARVKAGHVRPSDKPGLGVMSDEARVAAASRDAPDWHNPIWRHPDGSVAEW